MATTVAQLIDFLKTQDQTLVVQTPTQAQDFVGNVLYGDIDVRDFEITKDIYHLPVLRFYVRDGTL